MSIPRGFVVKKDVQSYTITPNKNKFNVAANACERFGIIRNISISILRFYATDKIVAFHISSISRYWTFDFEHCINFCDTMNWLINEKICVNSSSSEYLLHIFNATCLVPSHIQDSDGLLLSRAADDLVVRGYAHCIKSRVISPVSVVNLGCSQRHGKRKEEWAARSVLDADDYI